MAKKKEEEDLVVEGEPLAVISDQLSVNDDSPSPLTPLPLGEGDNGEYEEKSWMGKALYVCKACSFDVFDETEMLNHLIDKHNSESALQKFYEGKKE